MATRALKLLRWTVSILGGVGVVLFGVLWARSYWWFDSIELLRTRSQIYAVESVWGSAAIQSPQHRRPFAYPKPRFDSQSLALMLGHLDRDQFRREVRDFPRIVRLRGEEVRMPHWLWMTLLGVTAAAPWLRWRFSIRGVLVLMAFIAAMFAILRFE